MPTRSDAAGPDAAERTLATVRDVILADGVMGYALRDRLCAEYDRQLAALPVPSRGVALIAVGGLGRRDMAPYSDLDLVLVSDDAAVPSEIAERIWYPLWDSGIALDHATRTVGECLAVAAADLPALLGLLWARPVAGDTRLAIDLRESARRLWRTQARGRIGALAEACRTRWDLAGDGSSALEPDLKLSRGGLRDGQVLHALAVAHLADFPADIRLAHTFLLDVRGELHRHAARRGDVLRRQYQHSVAGSVAGSMAGGSAGWPAGVGTASGAADHEPADDLLRDVNLACRAVAHKVDGALRRAAAAAGGLPPRRTTPDGRSPRRPLARDLVADAGEIVLARSARVSADPLLMVRAARVASESGLPIAPYLVRAFAARTDPPATPWPAAMRTEFVRLLGGPAALDVLQTLDLAGLMTRLVPAWEAVRGRAQHNPVHRHTVDRHLMDTVASAAVYARDVTRPDLLFVSALLHDIGKIGAGDHAEVGAQIAENAVTSMGFDADDVDLVTTLVRRHLLLVDTATGRDLDDPRTVSHVLAVLGGRLDTLELLHALTRADARATGPAAWTPWRARLVASVVARARDMARGLPVEPPPALPPRWWRIAETSDLAVVLDGDDITVIAPDRPGVLNRTAGVLALHGLQVRAATVRTHVGKAVNTYHVDRLFGDLPDPAVLRGDLARALDDGADLPARLERKERDYRQGSGTRRPPAASWFERAATDSTVVEVRADWSIGSLYRITAALERCGLDVRAARVRSWANTVIDSFYVRCSASATVPAAVRAAVDAEFARIH